MRLRELELRGAYVIEPERREDERGYFARAWDGRLLREHGLVHEVVQANVSYNVRRGTLRGMHYQAEPHAEVKVVRCTRGAVRDVIVDVRAGSPTYGAWVGVDLTAENGLTLYVPEGCAHGYQTLEDGSEVFYLVSAYYAPEAERGIRWDDPAIGIDWPRAPERIISDKDRSWPDFEAVEAVDA